ncbi:MAG: hypothetical protein LH679_18410 [Cyanobacteria bacterium CAN_BIN43]|nr:hypothetical protein [Cyanobacteria bacterium CAN_BIN43]
MILRFSPSASGLESHLQQSLYLQGSPIYLTVGGIEPHKNSIALLTAFFQVLTTHPNAQLIIAGGDPNAVEAIAQAMLDVVQPTIAQSLIQQSQTVLSHYTWITAAQIHIKFYCDIQPQ